MRDEELRPREAYLHANGGRFFVREAGIGTPVLVVHGGPSFDHSYLLPELDRLAASFRLVYYDQRGRGRSAAGVRPEDVTIASEIEDLDEIRRASGLERTAVLGHSWGCTLALEYAVRHPERVSHLILLNTAPASHDGMLAFRGHLNGLWTAEEQEARESLAAGDRYAAGDLEADAAYNRIYFRPALHRPELVECVVGRLRTHFTPETIALARAIGQRLWDETLLRTDYDLRPRLAELAVPTLVLHGEDDFIPVAVAVEIAESIPGSVLRVLPVCGHFSYLEAPDAVEREVNALLG
jgi:proline iminopeptidase